MRWNDRIFAGSRGKWSWVVVREMIRELRTLTAEYHVGQRLRISAFDSGRITPSAEERKIGWTLIGSVMVSPPLTPQLHIPCGEYDEWYLYLSLPPSIDVTDQYVNYCGFNLADPHELAASQDSTWDRSNYDWLLPLQSQFWADMDRLDPSSYISSGDADIVVTRNSAFADHILKIARAAMK